ncbi:MAG: sigma-70 family RNA polymerase sigma factor [Thiohalophilus sp.]
MDKDIPSRVPAEQWLEEHGTALYRYALVRLRDPDKAEEAVQETLLAALQAYANYTGQSALRTWLIGILKHKILDQFRREAREESLIDPDEPLPDEPFNRRDHWSPRLRSWGDPESALQDSQFWRILQECLDRLPARLARLFVMRELLEDETENICQELTISPTNLWTMLYRARMRLRQCLDQNWVGESRRG